MRAWMAGAVLGVGLSCFGCAAHRQTVADLEAALVSFMPPEQGAEWLGSLRTGTPAARPAAPPTAIVVVWVPARPAEGVEPRRVSKAVRERWMAAIREKLEREGLAARVDVMPPDVFDDGVSLSGVRTVATRHEAELVVLFTVEITRRRYDAFAHGTTATGGASSVKNIVEVVSMARAIGVTPAGQPLFSGSKRGFDSEAGHMRSVDEVEEVSNRVAIEELGDMIVLHIDQVFYGRKGRTP
ncbi:MAG: hypothetical protein HY207_05485 [Nitrospirae bacterium]|nr:hypothetical protein [Nitrospirota bacterium]